MLKRKIKIFTTISLILTMLFAFNITAFAEVNTPSFFSSPINEGSELTWIVAHGGHIFLTAQNLNAVEQGMKVYLDVMKDATAEGSVTKHYAEIIKYRNIRMVLCNGVAYAPFVEINNTKTSAYYHSKILWCNGNFTDLPTALVSAAGTCDATGASNSALCGDYNTSVPRFLQFAVNQTYPNVLTYHLQMYDYTTNELLGDYALSDLKLGNYTGYEDWAKDQAYVNPDPGVKPQGTTIINPTSTIGNTTLEIVGGKPDAIKNSNDQAVGVKLTLKYSGDSDHKAQKLVFKDPDGYIMAEESLTENSGTVTKSFNNLTKAGTNEKPYSVELATVAITSPRKSVTYTFANPTILEDNNYSDHVPVITYTGLTGVPTYPQNTPVTVTIMTDVPSNIKVNGSSIVTSGTAGNYVVMANDELHVTAEANGQTAELTIPVTEFTDEVADVPSDGIEQTDDTGDLIVGKDGVVKDRHGNIKGLADGNGNILDAFGNKIGTYTKPDANKESVSENKAPDTVGDKEQEKLTQTGIDSPIIWVSIVIMILGCAILFGGRIYAKKSNKTN